MDRARAAMQPAYGGARLAQGAPVLYGASVLGLARPLAFAFGAALAFGMTFATTVAAEAQPTGVVPLRTGFTPDPVRFGGTTRGDARLAAAASEPSCAVGYFGATPSHLLELETRVGFMRLYATGEADLAIAVRDAEGRWHCNDDTYGRHPSVEGSWLPGRVEVFIGTHELGTSAKYELRLTEARSMRPGAGPEGGEAGDETGLARDAGLVIDTETGRFDAIRLRRGFLPDPRFLAGHTEPDDDGTVDISVLGGDCHGFTPGAPAHVITLIDDFDYLQLYVVPLSADRWPDDEPPSVSQV